MLIKLLLMKSPAFMVAKRISFTSLRRILLGTNNDNHISLFMANGIHRTSFNIIRELGQYNSSFVLRYVQDESSSVTSHVYVQ